jgi:hypothetical protein
MRQHLAWDHDRPHDVNNAKVQRSAAMQRRQDEQPLPGWKKRT